MNVHKINYRMIRSLSVAVMSGVVRSLSWQSVKDIWVVFVSKYCYQFNFGRSRLRRTDGARLWIHSWARIFSTGNVRMDCGNY